MINAMWSESSGTVKIMWINPTICLAKIVGLVNSTWLTLQPVIYQQIGNQLQFNQSPIATKTYQQHVELSFVLHHYFLYSKPLYINQLGEENPHCWVHPFLLQYTVLFFFFAFFFFSWLIYGGLPHRK